MGRFSLIALAILYIFAGTVFGTRTGAPHSMFTGEANVSPNQVLKFYYNEKHCDIFHFF
jgi:hypothetical protein